MFELTEATDNSLRALLALAMLPVVVVLARRVLGPRPFHLTDTEHQNYRLLSFGTIGALLALVGSSLIPSPLALVLAGWVAFIGLRIGSRLHLATALRARFGFGVVEIVDRESTRIECATGQSWHHASSDVASLLAQEAGPAERRATLSRGRLKSLPGLLDAKLRDAGGSREERRGAREDLAAFLRSARDCGCLVLEPADDPFGRPDPDDGANA